jgi:hypothetical protein
MHQLIKRVRALFNDLVREVLCSRSNLEISEALLEFPLQFRGEFAGALNQALYQANSHLMFPGRQAES